MEGLRVKYIYLEKGVEGGIGDHQECLGCRGGLQRKDGMKGIWKL